MSTPPPEMERRPGEQPSAGGVAPSPELEHRPGELPSAEGVTPPPELERPPGEQPSVRGVAVPPPGLEDRPGELPPAEGATLPPELEDRPGELPPAEGDASPPPQQPTTRIARFRAWRFAPVVEVLVTIAIALALAESVQAAVVKPFEIPSQSMEPTLIPGQRVLVNRLAYAFGGSPARGDIVVFHPPTSLTCRINIPSTEPCPVAGAKPASEFFVKRVIGLPGDHLWIEDGHPVINGHELRNEPYITPCGDSTSCEMPHVITIPRGEYFMMGDNRGDSDDSRYWGPVPRSWIIGEVFVTYWPPDRIGVF